MLHDYIVLSSFGTFVDETTFKHRLIKEYLKGEDVVLYKKDFNRLKVNRK